MGGGGGNSQISVAKFQYMPGGHGGGGGWAWPTAGEASSSSGRNATTMADTAVRCTQGFIGHLLSVGPCERQRNCCLQVHPMGWRTDRAHGCTPKGL